MFVLLVTVRVRPEMRERFLREIEENSLATVRDEPGCLSFDVVHDRGDTDRYFFYEVYGDEADYEAHTHMPHVARWRRAATECLAEPSIITRCTRLIARADTGNAG